MIKADDSKRLSTDLRDWVIVAFLLVFATAAGLIFDQHISLTSQAMLYVLAVVIVSYVFAWKESVVCALAAVTALNFFFVPPRWTFEVESQEHLIALFTMLLVALVISHLAAGLRRETAVAQLNEQRARQLQTLTAELSAAASEQSIVDLGQDVLNRSFDGPCVLVSCSPEGALPSGDKLEASMLDGMNCCMREAAVLGPGTGRWPGLNAWYLPLGEKGRMNGAACVQPALAADTSGREHARALCALIAQALWRMRLASGMLAAEDKVQRQQIQNTFLAAISHDLRTPLAAVVGAASALQTQREKLGIAEQDRLLESIVSEATYLSTITENTLQLVRLSNFAEELPRDWESMEEIVGAVLARVRRRDPHRRIRSTVPKSLPLIKADPVLLAQLIENLLDNALKYTVQAVELTVNAEGNALLVSVKDRGAGIPHEKLATIFEPYSRSDQSGQHGSGLGLALCRAVAHAHGGTLRFRPRGGGGSCFSLNMPIEAQQPGGAPA